MRSVAAGGAPATAGTIPQTTTVEQMSIRATEGIDRFLATRKVRVHVGEPPRPDRGRCPAKVLSSTATILQRTRQKCQSIPRREETGEAGRRRKRAGDSGNDFLPISKRVH